MTVAVDGVERYHWPVSTGIPSRETPSGSFRAFRMEEDHYSKEFDDAPMPHSIFFTKVGHAIHGTDLRPSRHPRLPRLRAAVARQRHDALCARAGGRRAQHHGDADRLGPGRAGAQSASAHQHRRRAPGAAAAGRPAIHFRRRSRRDHAAAAHGAIERADTCRAARRRRLHLSGRRLLQRGALSGAASNRRIYDTQAYQQQPQYYETAATPRRRRATTSRGRNISRAGCSIRISRRSRSQAGCHVAS